MEWRRFLEWLGMEVEVRRGPLKEDVAAHIHADCRRLVVLVNEGEDHAYEMFRAAVRFFEEADEGDWALGPWPLMRLAYELASINAHNVGPYLEVVRWVDEPVYEGAGRFRQRLDVAINVY